MSVPEAIYAKSARKKRLEKELKELYRIRHECSRLAAKGSAADQANLPFIQSGIEKAQSEIATITSWLNSQAQVRSWQAPDQATL